MKLALKILGVLILLALATPFDPRFTLVTDREPAPAIAASVKAAKARLEVASSE